MRVILCAFLFAILLQGRGRAASPPCWAPSGFELPNYGVCDPGLAASLCCHTGDTCLQNGLCSTHTGSHYYRGGCSDSSYVSSRCASFCVTDPLSAALSVCDNDGPGNGISVCCDLGRNAGVCCKNSSEIMKRGAPYSSTTAGPPRSTAASIMQDDDPDLPTSTRSGTITSTLRRTVSSSPSSTIPSSSSPNAAVSTNPPPAAKDDVSHSHLGAGLGGGLGGAAALLIGIAIFIYWRRGLKQIKESKHHYQEMEAPGPTYGHTPTLSPAELTAGAGNTWMEAAELPTKMPPGPSELQGDTAFMTNKTASPTSSDVAEIPVHHKPELADTSVIPGKVASPSSNRTDAGEMRLQRPLLPPNRPDSAHSQAGPWHDRF